MRASQASGGDFAEGKLDAGDRSLRLWYRSQLGGVYYHRAGHEVSHVDLMTQVGARERALYPGFAGDDPMSAFPRLLHDFEYLDVFFRADEVSFLAAIETAA